MSVVSTLNIKKYLGDLFSVEKVIDELERKKIHDNIIGFIPASEGTDSSIHICNLGNVLADRGYKVCIFDAKVFYPNIYKILGCDEISRGKGLLQLLRDDKLDFRNEILKTKVDNLYVLTASGFDNIEEYFEIRELEVERVMNKLKEMFDIVLIDIPNFPPLELCYVTINLCDLGFVFWGERIECPQNTDKLFNFLKSMGINTFKFANVVISNKTSLKYDSSIVKELNIKLVAEIPYILAAIDHALDGEMYLSESALIDSKYKEALEQLASIIIS